MGFVSNIIDRMIDKRIAAYQNELIQKHCEEVQSVYKTMRGWRHDYHNHIQALLALNGDWEETRKYLWKLNDDLTTVDTVIKTGNVMVDAILNSKLTLIKSKGIEVNARATVPKEMNISEIDLCTIIGNLLDNAMEACMELQDGERFIRVFIGVMKAQLYISVQNASRTELKKAGGKYLSTKGEDRGFGLMRIDMIAKRCGGYVNRQNEDGMFATEVLLPL